jgi:hypothetical protein
MFEVLTGTISDAGSSEANAGIFIVIQPVRKIDATANNKVITQIRIISSLIKLAPVRQPVRKSISVKE